MKEHRNLMHGRKFCNYNDSFNDELSSPNQILVILKSISLRYGKR